MKICITVNVGAYRDHEVEEKKLALILPICVPILSSPQSHIATNDPTAIQDRHKTIHRRTGRQTCFNRRKLITHAMPENAAATVSAV
jgi:hypothetical protein